MSDVTEPARNSDLVQHVPNQVGPMSRGTASVNFDKPASQQTDRSLRAAQQRAESEQRRRQLRQVREERKRPLPGTSAMVRHKKRVAMVSAESGYLTLHTADGVARYRSADARSGRLISGRIFLTNPDGSTTKVRAYLPGERAPSEVGATHKGSSDGGLSDLFSSLGDDPVSAVIALVVFVLMLIALPIVSYVWLRNRLRRSKVARRVLQAAANPYGAG